MYPVNLKLEHRPVVVIGGGRIAARKVAGLLAANAVVSVVSPILDPSIDAQQVCWKKQRYTPDCLHGQSLILACTNDPAVNRQVCADAAAWQWVNDASDKARSDFYNVAVIRERDVVITVSTDGQAPARARKIKKWLQQEVQDGSNRSEFEL